MAAAMVTPNTAGVLAISGSVYKAAIFPQHYRICQIFHQTQARFGLTDWMKKCVRKGFASGDLRVVLLLFRGKGCAAPCIYKCPIMIIM